MDLNKINCWIIYLMPFANRDDPAIPAYQQMCVGAGIFGMGWPVDDSQIDQGDGSLAAMDQYLAEYKAADLGPVKQPQSALDAYRKIRRNDLAIMRLRNGHFYVGRIAENVEYLHGGSSPYKELSWGCKVEKWYEEADESKVPSEIIGRFSQKRHPTIQRVADNRVKDLIARFFLYESGKQGGIEPFTLTSRNFVRSLDYRELEDLVCLYMYDKHQQEGYVMLPSSGKINQQKYEFRLTPVFATGATDLKDITCQVKNQSSFSIEPYKNETHFRIIYLFSGAWDAERIKEEYQGKPGYENVEIIQPFDLYQVMKKHRFYNSLYYKLED